jgi:hypothetical protein
MRETAEVAELDQDGPEGAIDITQDDSLSSRVVKYNVTFAQIAKLEQKYAVVPEDLSVKANYELVRKAVSHVKGLRVDVEKRRKELKADSLAWGRKVDGAAKELTEKLVTIEEPFATAKKDYDAAEEKRVDGIAERIATIKALVEANISATSESIMLDIENLLQDDLVSEWAMEFAGKAQEVISETVAKLTELHDMKHQQETFTKQQAEAEAKRIADEEEARKQREIEVEKERVRMEAERAKMEEERAAMEAERAKMAKAAEELAAIQKAKDDEREAAAEVERLRLVEEQAKREAEARAEQERKEAEARAEQAKRDKERDEIEAYAENERLKMVAEIEALKKAQEPVVEEIQPKEPVARESVTDRWINELRAREEKEMQEHNEQGVSDYKMAGRGMIKFISNREVTKNLLDAIVNGDIPNVKFTGSI